MLLHNWVLLVSVVLLIAGIIGYILDYEHSDDPDSWGGWH